MSDRDQPCPLNADDVSDMTQTLRNIDLRLQKIEQMMFAGRVLLTVSVVFMAAGAWIFEHADNIKHVIVQWLKN